MSLRGLRRRLFGTARPAPAPAPPGDPNTNDLYREIRRSFDESSRDEEHFPSTIDPRIQHVQSLLKFFGDLADKRVLDAGCGKGRFARVMRERHPRADIWGLDISEEMLKFIPAGIHRLAGSMTALPVGDSAFDAVYATESLEHAVEIERAVDELCRVLKPGGRLAIIDKNAEQWGRLETPPWEKWFRRGELERLLRHRCREVRSEYLSYWEDVRPDGLFVVWFAHK